MRLMGTLTDRSWSCQDGDAAVCFVDDSILLLNIPHCVWGSLWKPDVVFRWSFWILCLGLVLSGFCIVVHQSIVDVHNWAFSTCIPWCSKCLYFRYGKVMKRGKPSSKKKKKEINRGKSSNTSSQTELYIRIRPVKKEPVHHNIYLIFRL